jgi:predicted butyrate kinase (DUF1464 family)
VAPGSLAETRILPFCAAVLAECLFKVSYDKIRGLAASLAVQYAFMDIMPNQVKVADTAEGAMVSWDLNGDGAADGSVALVGIQVADLCQSDFMFNGKAGFVVGVSTIGSG